MLNFVCLRLFRVLRFAGVAGVVVALGGCGGMSFAPREDCESKSRCFGVEWRTATPAEVVNANVKAKDRNGLTPLHWAAGRNKNLEVVNALLAAGADVNAKNKYGNTPLHLAARFKSEVVNALLAAGADVNAKNKYGDTPLHRAVRFNSEVVNALVAGGADVSIKNDDGKTALELGKENKSFYKTEAYWELNEAAYD